MLLPCIYLALILLLPNTQLIPAYCDVPHLHRVTRTVIPEFGVALMTGQSLLTQKWLGHHVPARRDPVTFRLPHQNAVKTARSGIDSIEDSISSQILLTEEQLKHYIAVKKALATFWPSHQALLKTARKDIDSTLIIVPLKDGVGEVVIGTFRYPVLVLKDTTLANVFKMCGLTPQQFKPTQVSVFQAVAYIIGRAVGGPHDPVAATDAQKNIALKNMALATIYRRALHDVGVDMYPQNGSDGMIGSDDDNLAH